MAEDEKTTHDYKGLKVQARQTEEGSHVQLGVQIKGAWIPFAGYPTPGFEAMLAEAEAAEAEDGKSKSATK